MEFFSDTLAVSSANASRTIFFWIRVATRICLAACFLAFFAARVSPFGRLSTVALVRTEKLRSQSDWWS